MRLGVTTLLKPLFSFSLAMLFILGATAAQADKKADNLTGFKGEEQGNLPDYNYDSLDEQGWDVFEDPFGALIARETPYYQNDSRDIKSGDVFIKAWEYDPPNALKVRVIDQRALLMYGSKIDVKVEAGYYDDNKNLMVETRRIVRDIAIKPGENYLTLYFPVERTHIVHARVIKVRNNGAIKLLD
ncbi:hypothetical protein IOQ59_17955 [Pontibacterium sp. N1Y112]|uniref:Uncharacterized protein n=1 Tax=Pontibacterium sinense TaxID=2781979 RepID=A0A8J7K0I6_9GAMM|nr:hypothetical protein [Pontibacterium sinense]MBE9399149.1 hypothetical protein [Pontibacterium sinense]